MQELFLGLKSVPATAKHAILDLCKRYKKPKKYRSLQQNELKVLQFVTEQVCDSASQINFPAKGKEWSPFCAAYKGLAHERGVYLPKGIRQWNSLRQCHTFDVFNNLKGAEKWWLSARLENDLLTSHPPSSESITSGCKVHLLCPDDVAILIKVMRVLEVSRGVLRDKDLDYFRKGTHCCRKCRRPAVPICFKNTPHNCLFEPCKQAEQTEQDKKKRKREKAEKLQSSLKRKNITRNCNRCRYLNV